MSAEYRPTEATRKLERDRERAGKRQKGTDSKQERQRHTPTEGANSLFRQGEG